VDLAARLEHLFQLYLPAAEDCGHVLTRELPHKLTIRGDEELLTQLFSNLIENALGHTPAGTRIRLTVAAVNGECVASVIDNGPGVAPDELGKVTRRFYRGSSSRSSQGHGLGLSLVAAIAQLHGAKLQLIDAGRGLRVDLVFRQTDQVHVPDAQ
jgi:signal transduction histidine kinase